MNRLAFYLSFVILIGAIFSCKERTDLATLVPNEATGVGKINLPSIQSKVITWELIQEYLFSESGDGEQPDWSIDLDREAIFYSISSPRLLIPVSDIKNFEKALTKTSNEEVQTLEEYHYILHEGFYISWIQDYVIVSQDLNFVSELKPNQKNVLLSQLDTTTSDISFYYEGDKLFNQSLKSSLTANFEEGKISVLSNGNANSHKFLQTHVLSPLKNTKRLDNEYLASLNAPLNKKYLDQLINLSLPMLQANGLLFKEQFQEFFPYLDGRIQFGFEKEPLNEKIQKAQLALGTSEGFKPIFDSIVATSWTLDSETGFYKDVEDFQFMKLENDFLVLSNCNSSIQFKENPSLFSLDIARQAIKDEYLFYPKILFGTEAVDEFPISSISVQSSLKNEELSASLDISFLNEEDNSLISLIKYLTLIENRDEI